MLLGLWDKYSIKVMKFYYQTTLPTSHQEYKNAYKRYYNFCSYTPKRIVRPVYEKSVSDYGVLGGKWERELK
jgi:hypothetical protein